VVSEWLGKCYFRIVTFSFSGCCVPTMCFVARSMHRPPEIPMTRSWLLRRLSARVNNPCVVPVFPKLSMYLRFLGRFSAFRHRPGNGWCGCSGDGYPRCNHGKLSKHDRVEIKFVREPPCCQWPLRSLGRSIWHNSGVRISSRQGKNPRNCSCLGKGGVFFLP
jgi:hypothetical protein